MIVSLTANRVANRVLRSQAFVEQARLYRYRAGAYNDFGEWVDGGVLASDINLVTVPITGQERQNLPESLRERDVRKFYTLDTASAITPGESGGDVVLHAGTFYRIVQVRDWTGFRELMGVKPEETPPLPAPAALGAFSLDWSADWDT